jgi:DNA-binding response OmpR family regulator
MSGGFASPPTVLVLGADPPTLELLREWLAEAGYAVATELDARGAAVHPADPQRRRSFNLVIVDVPYPRVWRSDPLQTRAAAQSAAPVLALSATFHSSVERSGEVARSLGVAGVLAKPLRREALVNAVHELSRQPRP